jgi:small subunit ribosomal protein S17
MTYTGKRKVRIGQVVGNKMDKTVIVAVETVRHAPLYKKTIKQTKKYKVHDEANVCRIGDSVRIIETRPLSKEKCWRVTEIISRRELTERASGEVGKYDSSLHQTQGS